MKSLLYTFLLSLFSTAIFAANITITDADLVGGETYNWTADNTYFLDGFVFLEAGGTLNIAAGTTIKGLAAPTNDDLASTLIIARGAQIFAEGTKNNPIVFTAEFDDIAIYNTRKQWGGLVLLGDASITDSAPEKRIDGFPDGEDRALYGGTNDAHNGGILRYVSIRHGGAEVAEGDEINGLSCGGVGSGTTLEYIEVIGNSDDGIEFFGGTVDLKYAAVSFCGDDGIDWDTGWRGKGQFWFVLCGDDAAGNGGEHDGAKPDDNTPSSNPLVYNATFIGSGQNAAADIDNEHAVLLRDGSRGTYANSIFTDFNKFAIQVEDVVDGVDSYGYMEAGELQLLNNIWFQFGEGDELNAGENGIIQATEGGNNSDCAALIDHLITNGNTLEDPQLGGISRDNSGGLNPYPAVDGPAYQDLADEPADAFYTNVAYKGAFGAAEGSSWLLGWTALDEYGVLSTATGVAEIASEEGILLAQSTPNPTNGNAIIEFTLPATSDVTLVVTDMNGKQVATILNKETRQEGTHFVNFNGTDFAAGMYFYTLTTERTILTKSLIIN